jgi:hypothetical protein
MMNRMLGIVLDIIELIGIVSFVATILIFGQYVK